MPGIQPLRPAALSMLQRKEAGDVGIELASCGESLEVFWIRFLGLVDCLIWFDIPFLTSVFGGCFIDHLVGGFKI